jgi:hypothetical protein
VRSPADVEVREVDPSSFAETRRSLDELTAARPFAPHPGWRGFVERGGA